MFVFARMLKLTSAFDGLVPFRKVTLSRFASWTLTVPPAEPTLVELRKTEKPERAALLMRRYPPPVAVIFPPRAVSETLGLTIAVLAEVLSKMLPWALSLNETGAFNTSIELVRVTPSVLASLKFTAPPLEPTFVVATYRFNPPEDMLLTSMGVAAVPSPETLPPIAVSSMLGLVIAVFAGV